MTSPSSCSAPRPERRSVASVTRPAAAHAARDELDRPDDTGKLRLKQRPATMGLKPKATPKQAPKSARYVPLSLHGRELGGQRGAGDLEHHLREREEEDEGNEDAQERVGQEQRRRGGGEEDGPGEQRDDPRAPVDQVRDRKLEQYDHEPVGPQEEPYLPVRHPDEVLGVDRQAPASPA